VEAGWASRRTRPSGEGGWRLGLGKRGGPREEWAGQRPRPGSWAENWIWTQAQKEILFEFQLLLEFGKTLGNCKRRFSNKFDMGIFPKIF
jgi:hypothetical protein